MKPNREEYVTFMGVKLDNISYQAINKRIKEYVDKRGYVCLIDVMTIILAIKDKGVLAAINNSLISISDGMPLAWYGRLLGCQRIERISGCELLRNFLNEQDRYRHFLLGDTEETLRKVIYKARRENPSINISGYSPPMKNRFTEDDNRIMVDVIKKERPDIIWVSFGGGKQDRWMHENFQKVERGVMIGVGAAFRFYIGELRTPPNIFQKLGLQWAFRTIQEPKGLKRRLKTYPVFIFYFCSQLIKARKRIRTN
jgi:N-acetylglucosaminyldiphosphoundecaprenol N-acetyl-beta-D-mannosaminyltransferase